MFSARLLIVGVSLLAACKPSRPPSDDAADPAETSPEADAADASGDAGEPTCDTLPSHEEVRALFGAAREELEASREGEHFLSAKFEPAIARVRSAAEGGHREAQSLYGRTMFGMMFTSDAPSPEQREDYVVAIMFLRTAALGGDAAVAEFMPGVDGAQADRTEMPWSEIPAEWLTEAWKRSDAWIACHGKPWT